MSNDASTAGRPDPTFVTRAANDAFSVRKVFGEAYERDGTLVVPVAKVWGGTGTGYGYGVGSPGDGAEKPGDGSPAAAHDAGGEGAGGGGGYGMSVRPLGVYVVGPDGARWHPALDLNKVVLGGQAVAVVLALVGGWVLGRRHR
ncbi:spore germination protein GerW family protein [Oerskovia enterophila]|uniref:spore germination protein GerW family protein n=1 Tax=Oerskovia enterophila TaxID=43678 RepID=UPI00339317C9